MVTSRATSDCQSLAASTTSIAVPVASVARKVMMATTAVSERPAIELLGTIGVGAMRRAVRRDLVFGPGFRTRYRRAHS